MSIENDTPEEWVPFDTILCENGGCSVQYLYLGIGPCSYEGRSTGDITFVNDHQDCQLLLAIRPGRGITWSDGYYMRNHYHYHDRTGGHEVHWPSS